jgi:trehalose synthase
VTRRVEQHLDEMLVSHRPVEAFRDLSPDGYERARDTLDRCSRLMAGQVVWHVNTSPADGVAETLRSLLGYTRDAGVDARWLIARTDGGFEQLSRRLYNNLYGSQGDGGALGEAERELYERVTHAQGTELCERVRPGDVVYLHDPPLAGLLPAVRDAGAIAIWRCHLGLERPNDHARRAWAFLLPYLEQANAYVFSHAEYVWEQLDHARARVIHPSIDPFSPKNQELDAETVAAILDHIGLTATGIDLPPAYTRFDGSAGRIDEVAEIEQDAPVPSDAGVITQISGWERLKDQRGLIVAFSRSSVAEEANLVLAGPSVADTPIASEEREVLAALTDQRRSLPEEVRRRVHLVQIPTADRDDNATIVNALQRRADVIAHKPLQEGFGIGVTEAMWKARPVVATQVGGILEQIVDGQTGVLIRDADDLDGFAAAISELLADPDRRRALGEAAKRSVAEEFSIIDHLADYLELIEGLERSDADVSG